MLKLVCCLKYSVMRVDTVLGGRVGWLEKGGEGRGNSTFFTSQDTHAVSIS